MLEVGSSGSSVEVLLRGRVEESEVRSIFFVVACTDEGDLYESFLEYTRGRGWIFFFGEEDVCCQDVVIAGGGDMVMMMACSGGWLVGWLVVVVVVMKFEREGCGVDTTKIGLL